MEIQHNRWHSVVCIQKLLTRCNYQDVPVPHFGLEINIFFHTPSSACFTCSLVSCRRLNWDMKCACLNNYLKITDTRWTVRAIFGQWLLKKLPSHHYTNYWEDCQGEIIFSIPSLPEHHHLQLEQGTCHAARRNAEHTVRRLEHEI